MTSFSSSNIIFTGSFPYPSGMAGTKRIQNLIDVLNNYAVSNSVILNSNTKINPGIGIHKNTPFYTIFFSNKSRLIMIILTPIYIYRGLRLLLNSKIKGKKNILYIYGGVDIENIFMTIFAKIVGFKIIVDYVEAYQLNEESVSTWRRIKIKSMNFFERRLSNFADGIIVISSFLENKFKATVKNKPPIFLMPISAWVRDNKLINNSNSLIKKILYSGSYGVKDGVIYLLQAFHKLHLEFDNIELYLTGNPDNLIVNFIKQHNLTEKVHLKGYLEDQEYYKLLNNCDILCITRINSDYANAGFPFKLGEYLASGKPVVVTSVSDILKYLSNNEALLVKPEDAQAIYSALKYILLNPIEAKNKGHLGKQVCLKHFNPEINGKKFLEFIEAL